jgi:hypothetical protein
MLIVRTASLPEQEHDHDVKQEVLHQLLHNRHELLHVQVHESVGKCVCC